MKPSRISKYNGIKLKDRVSVIRLFDCGVCGEQLENTKVCFRCDL